MNTPDKTKATAAYYWRHVRKYPRLVTGIMLTLPLTVFVNNFLPTLIVANVLSKLSQHHYASDQLWSSFGPELVLYFVLMLSGVATWRFVDRFVWRLEGLIQRDIAEEVFNYLQNQTADFHANNFTGSLVSQTNKLLSGYVRVADTTMFSVIPLFAFLVFTSIILTPRVPLFVILLLLFTVVYMISAFFVSKPVRRHGERYAAAESLQTGQFADAMANVMVVKSFARGVYERQRFEKATSRSHRRIMTMAKSHRTQMNYLGFSSRLISGMSLTMAVAGVLVFHTNIGTVFLILNYTSSIVDRLFNFGNDSLRSYNRAFGDAHDMVEILAQPATVVDAAEPEALRIGAGLIAFKNVVFTHNGADDALFNKLNLTISAGEKIGLVGHSGSGKTTFTRLLLRFSDIDAGQISIDGQNIARLSQDDLHSVIGYVPQEPLLFHRSIRENIGYGKINASEEEVVRVAKLAHAHEFITLLPQGYDTLVGERGVKLSGGQRQRVAIARTLLKNAPILLLDEATSALDSESEVLIQDALWKLMEDKTAIVIAHRLSTIQKMDRIIVLDNGQIVEQGSHHELLKADGQYAKLWAHQSGGFIDD